jgi:hypothetical protein
METMVEFAATVELTELLRFMAALPQAKTAKPALLNAAHRIEHDNRIAHDNAVIDAIYIKHDGREG